MTPCHTAISKKGATNRTKASLYESIGEPEKSCFICQDAGIKEVEFWIFIPHMVWTQKNGGKNLLFSYTIVVQVGREL